MIRNIAYLFGFILLFQGGCKFGKPQKDYTPSQENPLFTHLTSKQTGVSFINILNEQGHINSFYYINIFNGGGVAIGDINNDDLPDLYFTGNMVSNKLYLNLGDMKFEDITASSGTGNNKGEWSTGVTMADVNADGYLDIYVSRSFSDENGKMRENLLYINNQDNTFTESAESYGLNDSSYSTQAVFFDYDLDGDLDMLLGNHPREFDGEALTRKDKRHNPPMFESDKLYRNNGDLTFTNVTKAAGILNHGYTLGIMVSDLNNDGWPDIYVAVDHGEPDNYYLNNQDGTFTNIIDEAIKHISQFSMGVDLADLNNDKLLDVIVVDMLASDNYRQKTQMSGMSPENFWLLVDSGYHYQYMRNVLQLNNGNNSFSEIGQLAGITKTDWSWAVLANDFDNDGWKDIFISNGYRKDIRDQDFQRIHDEMAEEAIKENKGLDATKLFQMANSTRLNNYYFHNNGDLTFTDQSTVAGFTDPGFSNGAAYADLDNDGDLDIVINNIADIASIYRNNTNSDQANYLRIKLIGEGQNTNGLGAKITVVTEHGSQYQEQTLTKGFQSSVEAVMHFGLGKTSSVDEIKIEWPGGNVQILNAVNANQVITVKQSEAKEIVPGNGDKIEPWFVDVTNESGVKFVHQENEYDDYEKESLLPHKMSQFGPCLCAGDVDGDGFDDFYIGGAHNQAGALYLQKNGDKFEESVGQPWKNDRTAEDVGCAFFDADNDGDLDLYIVSGGNEFKVDDPLYQDRLFINNGSGVFTKSIDRLPSTTASGSCVVPNDYDNDGDIDLFVGGRVVPGKYPFPPRSYLLRNEGSVFTDVTIEIAPALEKPGLVTSAVWTDFDGNGNTDLIVVGEWMPVMFFKNINNKLEDVTKESGMENTTGWWNKIVAADLDDDGDDDYVLGNLGLNYKYQASVEEPTHIYTYDFDNSGSLDIVLSYYNQGKHYPLRGKECTSGQMPFINDKFPTYHDFGNATLEDIYGEDLNKALHYEATNFASSIIMNEGGGVFVMSDLPIQAQYSTVNGIIVHNLNRQEGDEILLAGNFYASEVETGRADASIGLFLERDKAGTYSPLSVTKSGFFADKDVKDFAILKGGRQFGVYYIVVANNNDRIQIFEHISASIIKLGGEGN